MAELYLSGNLSKYSIHQYYLPKPTWVTEVTNQMRWMSQYHTDQRRLMLMKLLFNLFQRLRVESMDINGTGDTPATPVEIMHGSTNNVCKRIKQHV